MPRHKRKKQRSKRGKHRRIFPKVPHGMKESEWIGRHLKIQRLEREIAVLEPKVARLEQQKAEASDRERYHALRLRILGEFVV